MTKRTIKVVEAELRAVMDKIMLVRENLMALETKRRELVAEYKTIAKPVSSSVLSGEKFGSPGVIQGPPPKKEDSND